MTTKTLHSPSKTAIRIDPAEAAALKFVLIPRVLCNWPIVRPPATQSWTRAGDFRVHNRYRGEDDVPRVRVAFHMDDEPRMPTAADFDLLLRLVALAVRVQSDRAAEGAFVGARQDIARGRAGAVKAGDVKTAGRRAFKRRMRNLKRSREDLGPVVLEFASTSALIAALGRNPRWAGNYDSVRDSLDLWTRASFDFPAVEGNKDLDFRPWQSVREGKPLRITLRAHLLALINNQYAKVPLPLPTSAAALNLTAYLAAWCDHDDEPRRFRPDTFAAFCKRMGIMLDSNKARSARLSELIVIAGKCLNAEYNVSSFGGRFHIRKVAANPGKSNVALAEEIGVGTETIRRAREKTAYPNGEPDKRTGKDGKVRRSYYDPNDPVSLLYWKQKCMGYDDKEFAWWQKAERENDHATIQAMLYERDERRRDPAKEAEIEARLDAAIERRKRSDEYRALTNELYPQEPKPPPIEPSHDIEAIYDFLDPEPARERRKFYEDYHARGGLPPEKKPVKRVKELV